MTETNPVARVLGWVLGPLIRWVGQYVERRVRRALPELPRVDLPEPPVWFVPVVVAISFVGAVLIGADPERSECERAEPEPEATAERGTTSTNDESGEMPVEDALEALEMEHPPPPEKSEVKAAYRSLAMETHPDQGGDAGRFMEVREAWEAVEGGELSDGAEDGGVTQGS